MSKEEQRCDCGGVAMYGPVCRECHEDKLRREMRDALDRDLYTRARMMLHKERCRMRLRNNYDGQE